MQEDKTQNLSKTTASFILGAIIIIIIAGGIYILSNGLNNSNESVNNVNNSSTISSEVDTSDWIAAPFFSEKLNFYFYYPADWELPTYGSFSVNDQYYSEEGSFLWLSNSNEYVNGENISISVGKYLDTGQNLEDWVNLKKTELERVRNVSAELSNLEFNNTKMIEACVDGRIYDNPAPACFVYLHEPPYIVELRLDSLNAPVFDKIKLYTSAFASGFHLLDGQGLSWDKYNSFNGGYEISYLSDEAPLDQWGNSFYHSFGQSNAYTPLGIQVNTGATYDLEKYWYDQAAIVYSGYNKLPIELNIDNQRCMMSLIKGPENTYGDGYYQVFCKVNDKFYTIQLSLTDDDYLESLFYMLSSLKFTTDNKVDSSHYRFESENGGFQFDYPASYVAVEESSNSWKYIGFNSSFEILPERSFSVTYQKYDNTLEKCAIEPTCMLFRNEFSNYNNSMFNGISCKERQNPVQEGSNTQNRNIVFKKDGKIYSININTSIISSNDEVNYMLSSFKFIN